MKCYGSINLVQEVGSSLIMGSFFFSKKIIIVSYSAGILLTVLKTSLNLYFCFCLTLTIVSAQDLFSFFIYIYINKLINVIVHL
ncbi:hypothetical protein BY996DRAFT_8101727 [Phakopsora pachyrhizi]|nr:hypothetical protein BY996DRAFT_8101727 [Phakopsora pachyrhizi]